jgi:hypothetical protein
MFGVGDIGIGDEQCAGGLAIFIFVCLVAGIL